VVSNKLDNLTLLRTLRFIMWSQVGIKWLNPRIPRWLQPWINSFHRMGATGSELLKFLSKYQRLPYQKCYQLIRQMVDKKLVVYEEDDDSYRLSTKGIHYLVKHLMSFYVDENKITSLHELFNSRNNIRFEVLRALYEVGGMRGLDVTELCMNLSIPRSSFYYHLKKLMQLGFITPEGSLTEEGIQVIQMIERWALRSYKDRKAIDEMHKFVKISELNNDQLQVVSPIELSRLDLAILCHMTSALRITLKIFDWILESLKILEEDDSPRRKVKKKEIGRLKEEYIAELNSLKDAWVNYLKKLRMFENISYYRQLEKRFSYYQKIEKIREFPKLKDVLN